MDDVIKGGKLAYDGGCIALPDGPGLGVELDYDKVNEYHQLYLELGGYPYDRDPVRKGWYGVLPNPQFADPKGEGA
jgi:glucarate dehydratase